MFRKVMINMLTINTFYLIFRAGHRELITLETITSLKIIGFAY